MRKLKWLGVVGLLAGALVGPPLASAAPPTVTVFSDAVSDSGAGPDIKALTVTSSEDGRIRLTLSLSRPLTPDERFGFWIDCDDRTDTGSDAPATIGRDFEVFNNSGLTMVYPQWRITGFRPLSMVEEVAATSEPWVEFAAVDLGIQPGARFGISAYTYSDDGNDGLAASENPQGPWALKALTSAPPPPAPIDLNPLTPNPFPPVVPRPSTARVGLYYSKGKLYSALGWTSASGRVRWTLTLKARVAGKLKVRTIRSTGPRSSAPRRLVIFKAPRRTRINATFVLVDAAGTSITRTASIRSPR